MRFTRVPCDCGRCQGWELIGPTVFPVKPDDETRPRVIFAAGNSVLQARFPRITSKPLGKAYASFDEVPVEVIAPVVYHPRPLARDPYHLPGSAEEDARHLAALAEQQRVQDAA